jgi:hypothetical protein
MAIPAYVVERQGDYIYGRTAGIVKMKIENHFGL